MQMIVEYPDLLPDAMRMSRSEFEQEARMAMAVKLFEMGKLSSGYAAQLAGVRRFDQIRSRLSFILRDQHPRIRQSRT